MEYTIEQVQDLKAQLEATNTRLINAKAQLDMAKKRQEEILKEHNVESFEQLNTLLVNKQSELTTLMFAARQYLNDVIPYIEEVENAIKML